jgi:hypothetical protein
MRREVGIDGRAFLTGRVMGRTYRLFWKPWAWPYAYRAYGCTFAGAATLGLMLFGVPRRPYHD